MSNSPIRVFFCCSSVGITNRGIESFFREAFDNLKQVAGIELTLLKGGGEERSNEFVIWTLPKTGRAAQIIGKITGRSSYAVEQWTSFFPIWMRMRTKKPHVVFSSDANLLFLLKKAKPFARFPYCLLFSNGGPCLPPFTRMDAVHQVAPSHHQAALAAGESAEKQFFIPYGISVPDGAPEVSEAIKREVREQLGLPVDRKIVLSVGWISAQQKRMDYLVNEVAALPQPRPYLVLLGSMDEQSKKIVDLARAKLGGESFMARSVSHEQVATYYRAADVFALASLQEGFGRVFLEALIHGLPVIAHNHPVMQFVIGDQGTLADLSRPGELARALGPALATRNTPEAAARRRESIRRRFTWELLAPQYRDMFIDCARRVQPSLK